MGEGGRPRTSTLPSATVTGSTASGVPVSSNNAVRASSQSATSSSAGAGYPVSLTTEPGKTRSTHAVQVNPLLWANGSRRLPKIAGCAFASNLLLRVASSCCQFHPTRLELPLSMRR